jgi:AcrR family transcriptional regulator
MVCPVEHPRHLPADARRAVTVEAVIALAAEQNPSEITTAAIAQRMKLTQGALFRHFANKEAIWQAVMDWVAEQLLTRIEQAARDAASPLQALEAMFFTHVDFVARNPGIPRILFGELQRCGETPAKRMVQALLGRYSERLRVCIEAGKRAGQLAAEVDSLAAATLFIGVIQGLVMQSLLAGDVQLMRRQAPGAFALYRRGIGRSDESARHE